MGFLGKSSGTSSMLPGRGLINPAFVIKIVPANDDLQQRRTNGRDNPYNDYLDKIKTGTRVEFKNNGKMDKGVVQRIIKNSNGDGVFVEVMTDEGKLKKIEGSQIKIIGQKSKLDDDTAQAMSSPAIFNENEFLCYDDFLKIY